MTKIKMITTMGNITMQLYNETPLHRDNFIKLVEQGDYDSIVFHRAIKDFIIQAGDMPGRIPTKSAQAMNAVLNEPVLWVMRCVRSAFLRREKQVS
jgi:cyclophilin family peptidyl-prolyl cis-trans isomerase